MLSKENGLFELSATYLEFIISTQTRTPVQFSDEETTTFREHTPAAIKRIDHSKDVSEKVTNTFLTAISGTFEARTSKLFRDRIRMRCRDLC